MQFERPQFDSLTARHHQESLPDQILTPETPRGGGRFIDQTQPAQVPTDSSPLEIIQPDFVPAQALNGHSQTERAAPATLSPDFPPTPHRTTGAQLRDESFDQIVGDHETELFNRIYRFIGDPETARELTQETLLRAWAGMPKLDGEIKVRPWLFTIATNLCLDQLRRRGLIKWQPWQNFANTFHPSQVSEHNPATDVLRQERRELVHEVLQNLPPRYRICLTLREKGLSCQEIGDIIGSSRSAVKSLLFRARDEFRDVYIRFGGETDPL